MLSKKEFCERFMISYAAAKAAVDEEFCRMHDRHEQLWCEGHLGDGLCIAEEQYKNYINEGYAQKVDELENE